MNILFITENSYKGGLDSFIVTLLNHWPNHEDTLYLVCNASHLGIETYKSSITRPVHIVGHEWPFFSEVQHKIPRRWWRKLLIPFVKYGLFCHNVFAVWRFCRTHAIDRLLVVNGGYPAGDSCRAASCCGLLIPRLRTIHNFHSLTSVSPRILRPFENILDRAVAAGSMMLIAVSGTCARSLQVRPHIFQHARVAWIYNGVPVRTAPLHYRKDLAIPSQAPLLVMLGTYEPHKGHAFLLDAFQRICAHAPEAHLVFAGGGTAAERATVAALTPSDLREQVHCLDFITDASALIADADVLLMGSQEYESFGLTVIEAALVGTPVVVTDVGGLPEVVQDDHTGFVVPPDRPDLFAERVLSLLNSMDLVSRLTVNAKKRAEHLFAPSAMAERYAHLLRQGFRLPDASGEWGTLTCSALLRPSLAWQALTFLTRKTAGRLTKMGRRMLPGGDAPTSYGLKWYPSELLPFLEAARNALPPSEDATSGQQAPSPVSALSGVSGVSEIPQGLPLATRTVPLASGCVQWEAAYEDSEDTESLHRWNFLRSLTATHGQWVADTLTDWCTRFMHECRPYAGCPMPRWESYTIAERISNACRYYQGGGMPQVVHASLAVQAHFLLSRCEYFGPGTGNHAFNNARGIYHAAVLWNMSEWKDFARAIFAERLPKLITADGFLREGSSHYHLLFTRWVRELHDLATSCGDTRTIAVLERFLPALLSRCNFWCAGEHLELAGDISPDFSPSSVVASYPDITDTAATCAFPDSGWFRAHLHGFTLLTHQEAAHDVTYPWHQHNDALHISLSDEGIPLLVDPGRLTYNEHPVGGSGQAAMAHNTVFCNGHPLAPERPWQYPALWARPQNSAVWPDADGSFRLISDGFTRFGQGRAQRCITLTESSCVIHDTLHTGHAAFTSLLHWGEGLMLTTAGPQSWTLEGHGRQWHVAITASHTLEHFFPCAASGGPLSGLSRAYGQFVPAPVLALRTTGANPWLRLVISRSA